MNNILTSLEFISLQRTNYNLKTDGILKKLRELRNDRFILKLEIDKQLIARIMRHIECLSEKYDLFVSIGKLTNIRKKAQRGNGNKAHRKRIHKWAFARITTMLEHKLSLIGLEKRFLAVNEAWTSSKCWKCNKILHSKINRH